jgi:hypothetical protein
VGRQLQAPPDVHYPLVVGRTMGVIEIL